MNEPAFMQPIIPGVVVKVVPLKIPLTKLNTPNGVYSLSMSVKIAVL